MSRKEKKAKRQKKRKHSILTVTTVMMVAVVGICSLFTWLKINDLENGILDVCAAQQDEYVKLVLDQINIKENRDNEEIIRDILGALDASSNKYWTFSEDHAMLFVKDVIETNRYKGITTASYYNSESAKEFFNALQRDRVIHKNITINNKNYLASGVIFGYNGGEYKLCLLTNKDVILNNNRFMTAKIELLIFIAFIMILMLSTTMFLALRFDSVANSVAGKDELIRQLQKNVGHLNELLSKKEHYDTRYQMWNGEMLSEFLEKLKNKNVKDVVVARLHCQSEEVRNDFISRAGVVLDKRVLRFVVGNEDVYLLFIQYNMQMVKISLNMLINDKTKLVLMERPDMENIIPEEYANKIMTEE